MLSLEVRSRIDFNDLTAFDGDAMVLENSTFTVHCYEDTILYQEIDQIRNH
jgi:hypothetical protein